MNQEWLCSNMYVMDRPQQLEFFFGVGLKCKPSFFGLTAVMKGFIEGF